MSDDAYGDPVHHPFWEAAARGELVVQRCGDCGGHQLYGRRTCRHCLSHDLSWVKSSGKGTVYSRTEVHGFSPGDAAARYTVALVDLEEGPRLMTNIVNGPCEIGDRVKVCWQSREDAPPLPQFEPA